MYAEDGVNCSDGDAACWWFLFRRRKKRIIPTAMSTTAAAPITIPAIAPPPSLFDLEDEAGAEVEVWAEDVGDVEVDDVEDDEGEGVAVEDGADVDWAVELLRPPGCRS